MIFHPLSCSFFIFGGLNNNNVTLNDMWKFDLETFTWMKIQQHGTIPLPRCGHSFNYHDEKIILFGGLIEVTKESCETFKFDLATHTWSEIGSSATIENNQTNNNQLLENYLMRKPSAFDTIQPETTNNSRHIQDSLSMSKSV